MGRERLQLMRTTPLVSGEHQHRTSREPRTKPVVFISAVSVNVAPGLDHQSAPEPAHFTASFPCDDLPVVINS
jgi:hypothetical protein